MVCQHLVLYSRVVNTLKENLGLVFKCTNLKGSEQTSKKCLAALQVEK